MMQVMGVAEAGVTGIVADTVAADTAGVAGTVAADTIAANTMAANTVAADTVAADTVTADSMTDTVTDTVTQTMALADHTVSLADHMGALAVDNLGLLMHLHVHGHVLHDWHLHVLHHRHGHLDGLDDRVGVGHGVVLHVGNVVAGEEVHLRPPCWQDDLRFDFRWGWLTPLQSRGQKKVAPWHTQALGQEKVVGLQQAWLSACQAVGSSDPTVF